MSVLQGDCQNALGKTNHYTHQMTYPDVKSTSLFREKKGSIASVTADDLDIQWLDERSFVFRINCLPDAFLVSQDEETKFGHIYEAHFVKIVRWMNPSTVAGFPTFSSRHASSLCLGDME